MHTVLLSEVRWAPDQGSMVDFFLFPCLKNIMKGAHFADVAEIQEHVTGSVNDS
jgi:hypothetical protein